MTEIEAIYERHSVRKYKNQKIELDKLDAVSYTHLTLPTKA